MATITLSYDGRNTVIRDLIAALVRLDGINVENKKRRKNSFKTSLEELNTGELYEAKDGKDLVAQCLK